MFNKLYLWSMKVNPALWEGIGITAVAVLITIMVGVN
jgi:hypothetical protein